MARFENTGPELLGMMAMLVAAHVVLEMHPVLRSEVSTEEQFLGTCINTSQNTRGTCIPCKSSHVEQMGDTQRHTWKTDFSTNPLPLRCNGGGGGG